MAETILLVAILFGGMTGQVRFHGPPPAPPPAAVVLRDKKTCGASQPDESVRIGAGGEIANVVIWAADVPLPAGTKPKSLVIDQQGCRFLPHVTVARPGDVVTFTNSDALLHTTHAYRDEVTAFNIALPSRDTRVPKTMKEPGAVKLGCDSGHDWMRAWIRVVDSSFVAVTGSDGRFSLEGLGPGKHTLHAWHEKLGEKEVSVDGDHVELSFP